MQALCKAEGEVEPGSERGTGGMKVGLVGFAKTGKDTAAANMSGWHRAAFADDLKRVVSQMLKCVDLDITQEDWLIEGVKDAWRPLLVAVGAGMRKVDQDYWVRRLIFNLCQRELSAMDDVVIPDARYLSECDWIYRQKGICIRIHRAGFGPANDEERHSIQLIDQMWPGMPSVANDNLTPAELGLRCLEIVREARR